MIGPGGKPLYMYVLYGELMSSCLLSTRFMVKSLWAKITVGSASRFIPMRRRLRYRPATMGLSLSCRASASTIEARIITSGSVRLIAAAFSLRYGVQNFSLLAYIFLKNFSG